MIDTTDTGGVMIPLAIIATCLVIIAISIVVRRRKRRREGGVDDGAVAEDLTYWQSTHGHDVDRWLDAHEGSLPSLVPGTDPAIDAELDQAMAAAAEQCPNPDVSAMLAGMRRTATATREALAGNDRDAAEAAHEEYGRHRADAITAMSESDLPAAG